jgi:ArsR family transcriptional regulator
LVGTPPTAATAELDASACGTASCAPDTRGAAPGVDGLDALFRGFADPTRLRLLNVLAAGELCVCDLVELLALPQPLVSRHLAYLRRSGLVDVTRAWKFAHYRLADPATAVHANLIACVRSCFRGIASLDVERARAEARVRAREADPC